MPAEITTRDNDTAFAACEIETNLTDAEIAAIIRNSAGGAGVTDRIDVMVLLAVCKLGKAHVGPHASWVAISYDSLDRPATAWLRWSEKTRAVDWLAYCVTGKCLLFRGHVGHCHPSRGLVSCRPPLNREKARELGAALLAFADEGSLPGEDAAMPAERDDDSWLR